MANINKRHKQLIGKNLLKNLPISLQRRHIPQQPQQQQFKLLKSLGFLRIINILKLDHMRIGGMRPDQQNDHIIAPILNELGADVVVQHQMGEDFYGQDQLLVVHWLADFQAYQRREVV